MTVKFNIGNFVGEGETKAKARDAAIQAVEESFNEDWAPAYLSEEDWAAIVARTPGPAGRIWGYRLINPALKFHGYFTFDANYPSKEAACEAAAYHLAQQTGTMNNIGYLLSDERKKDLDSYFKQLAEYHKNNG